MLYIYIHVTKSTLKIEQFFFLLEKKLTELRKKFCHNHVMKIFAAWLFISIKFNKRRKQSCDSYTLIRNSTLAIF